MINYKRSQVQRHDLPAGELQATFPQIAHFAAVSTKTGLGIQELRQTLMTTAYNQNYYRQKVPKILMDLEGVIVLE